MQTAIPHTCSTVTVLSLSVNAQVGTPSRQRSVRSTPITTDGIVLSRSATTTRNRDHASHAQNSTAREPATAGPSP
jgi:hypothetical protein